MSSAPLKARLPSYEEAAALVGAYAARLVGIDRKTEQVDLGSALGRVLAQDICADRDQPPFTRSTRDGFACRAHEASAHKFLKLAGLSAPEASLPGLCPKARPGRS